MLSSGFWHAQCPVLTQSHSIETETKRPFFASLVQTTSCATAFSVSNLQSTLLLLHSRQIDLFFKETKN